MPIEAVCQIPRFLNYGTSQSENFVQTWYLTLKISVAVVQSGPLPSNFRVSLRIKTTWSWTVKSGHPPNVDGPFFFFSCFEFSLELSHIKVTCKHYPCLRTGRLRKNQGWVRKFVENLILHNSIAIGIRDFMAVGDQPFPIRWIFDTMITLLTPNPRTFALTGSL